MIRELLYSLCKWHSVAFDYKDAVSVTWLRPSLFSALRYIL